MKRRLSIILMFIMLVICTMSALAATTYKDGTYNVSATIDSTHNNSVTAATLNVKESNMTVKLTFKSTKMTTLTLDGKKYFNEAAEGSESTFTIPINVLDSPIAIEAITTAMGGKETKIHYNLVVNSSGVPVAEATAGNNETPQKPDTNTATDNKPATNTAQLQAVSSSAPASTVEASSTTSSSTAQSTVEASSETMSLTATPDPGKSEDAPDMGLFIAIIVAVIVVGGAAIFIITKIRKNKET